MRDHLRNQVKGTATGQERVVEGVRRSLAVGNMVAEGPAHKETARKVHVTMGGKIL